MNLLIEVFVFILGTCIGSFLNVCIYRLPKQKSIIKPGSYCIKCNKPLRWYANIPILSYVFLRGRCLSCKEKISFRYPLVELITGILFLVLFMKFGFSITLARFMILFCILIVVSFIDIDYHAIPGYLCVLGIIIALAFALRPSLQLIRIQGVPFDRIPIVMAFKGLIFGLGFTYVFKLFGDVFIGLYLQFRKKDSIEGERESLGLGDVDFMGMVGAFLGLKSVVLAFFIAPFLAVIYSIFAIVFKRSHLIPYLPYLSLATIVTFFWGDKILSFIF